MMPSDKNVMIIIETVMLELTSKAAATVVSVGAANCTGICFLADRLGKKVIGQSHIMPVQDYIANLFRIARDESKTQDARREQYYGYWRQLQRP